MPCVTSSKRKRTKQDADDILLLTDGTEGQSDINNPFPKVITRSSPKILVDAMKSFNQQQRIAVEKMGFGCLFYLKIKEFQTQLVHWLLSNFDSVSCQLDLGKGRSVHVSSVDVLHVMECPERYRVICAQLQLTGDARLWWNAYWSMRPGEKAGCTWEMFKDLIREKYYPTYYRAEMERQFLSLQQGTRTVDEYEREFTRLAAFVPDLVRTEAQRAQRFIDGLYPAVHHNIVGHRTQTYARAVSIAQEVDASIRREAVRDQFQPSAPAQSSSVPPMPALPSTQPQKNNKRKGKGAPTDKRTRRRL
ncbi:Unknown protein, partial [Striga hermonthica]